MPGSFAVESEAIVASLPAAVIVADLDGTIRIWNAEAVRIFGHGPEDALGSNLDLIIPESFRESHWKGFERATREGRTKYSGQTLPTRALRKDGTTCYVELGFAILTDSAGDATAVVATAYDITERFERERANRKKLAALEERVRVLESGAGVSP